MYCIHPFSFRPIAKIKKTKVINLRMEAAQNVIQTHQRVTLKRLPFLC